MKICIALQGKYTQFLIECLDFINTEMFPSDYIIDIYIQLWKPEVPEENIEKIKEKVKCLYLLDIPVYDFSENKFIKTNPYYKYIKYNTLKMFIGQKYLVDNIPNEYDFCVKSRPDIKFKMTNFESWFKLNFYIVPTKK